MTTALNGVYYIQNVGTGTVLELTSGSSVNGTKVQGHAKRELHDIHVSSQLWIITQVSRPNQYTIQNKQSRTWMDLTASNPQNGTPIIGYQPTGNPNQRWMLSRSSNPDTYVIANAATGTYIDLYNGGRANGTPVNGWASQGPTTTNTHQIWRLIRA